MCISLTWQRNGSRPTILKREVPLMLLPSFCCCRSRGNTMTDNPVCPETGASMRRDVRPMTLTYKGESITFDQPGWYCDQSDEGILVGKDLKISDQMLNRLKARSEGLLEPEEIRRIRKKLRLTQEAAGLVIGG